MQIDIRLVRPEDAAQIIEYAKIVGAETDCLILDENGMPGLTIEKEADLLRQLPTEHSAIYGAFCGTLPIGIANIQGSAESGSRIGRASGSACGGITGGRA